MLRTAGVNIPPQLMRGPNEPGYRDREPILVSVCAAKPVVKAGAGKVTERGKVIHPSEAVGFGKFPVGDKTVSQMG
jgi:hypothetical protein